MVINAVKKVSQANPALNQFFAPFFSDLKSKFSSSLKD